MDLQNVIDTEQFAGAMTVSDIHANWHSTAQAIDYARDHNLFIIFLGDLVDSKRDKSPKYVIREVLTELKNGNAAFLIGNHESKYYRKSLGNPVEFTDVHYMTISDYGNEDEFYEDIVKLVEHENSGYLHTHGKWYFTHAAVSRSLWDPESDLLNLNKEQQARALYGEVTGKRYPLTKMETFRNIIGALKEKYFDTPYEKIIGMPIRTYRWITYIPISYSCIVGHDRAPIDKKVPDGKPTIYRNKHGGTVYFTDTGSGKAPVAGPVGVTSVVLKFVGTELEFEHIEFFPNDVEYN